MKEINLFQQAEVDEEDVTAEVVPATVVVERKEIKPSAPRPVIDPLGGRSHAEKQDFRLQMKRVIEAILFASREPLTLDKIREVIDTIQPLPPREVRSLIQSLQDDYYMQKRAFRIEEIAQGFTLRSCEDMHPFIEVLFRNKRAEKLSQASAETLAIIAYRQPITRPQMEAIRGVDCSGVVQALLERQLIEPVGKLEAPGRPTLYGTTKDFLEHFGLRDISELHTIATMQNDKK